MILQSDLATEHPCEPAGNRQAKTRSTSHRLTSRAGIDLLEFVEDSLEISRGDSNSGVGDLKCDPGSGLWRLWCLLESGRAKQTWIVASQPRRHADRARIRVLYGVAEEIEEHLPEMRRDRP